MVLFLPPALLLFTILVVLPIIEAGWYSFYDWSGYGLPTHFIGWRNFWLISRYPAFRTAIFNNLLIIVVSLGIQLPFALWLATLVSNRIPGALAFRMIFFLPYVLADVAAGLIWRFMFDGDYGLIAAITHGLGIASMYPLADPNWAIYAILLVILWKYFGFHMMLFIAGLQGIDRNLFDAADIDGANRWQRFRSITSAAACADYPAVGVLLGHWIAATVRRDHAADQGRTGRQHADAGDVPLQLRHYADEGWIRQRRRRGTVRDLRRLRLQLQAPGVPQCLMLRVPPSRSA